jgi:hypothetical protein
MRLKIVDGLQFDTRMDALETVWGQDQQPSAIPSTSGGGSASNWRKFNQQNFSFERAYVTFKTGIGQFRVGYQSGTPYSWGTKFMNAPGTAPGIKYTNKLGNFSVLADVFKQKKGSLTNTVPNYKQSDADQDYYDLGASTKFKGGEAGALVTYFRRADQRAATSGYLTTLYNLQPYVKTKLGPVNVEAEAFWATGKKTSETGNTSPDVDYNMKGFYANGKYQMGAAHIGGIFAYVSGDDPTTADKIEGGISGFGYGTDTDMWGVVTPTILFGYGYHGLGLGNNAPPTHALDPGTSFDNVWMYQLYGGYAVSKKLDFDFKLSYAKADQDGAASGWQSKDYGKELDLKATYKIYDQLTYNVGFAYLWTGDWFKGTDANASVNNVYYVTHWIDLNF